MRRDYTQAKLDELIGTIDEVEKRNWTPFTDALGDVALWIVTAVGFIDIENYLNRLDEYYKYVIDRDNIKIDDVKKIFHRVEEADYNGAQVFNEWTQYASAYTDALKCLTEAINPNVRTLMTNSTVKRVQQQIQKMVAISDRGLAEWYSKELIAAQERVVVESAKDFGSNILSGVVEIVSFPLMLMEKGPAAFARAGWGLINDVFAAGQSGTAVLCGTVGLCVGLYGTVSGAYMNNSVRHCLDYSEDYQKRDGLADELEAESGASSDAWGKTLGKLSYAAQGIDLVMDVADIKDGAIGLKDTILGTEAALNTGKKMGYMKTLEDAEKMIKKVKGAYSVATAFTEDQNQGIKNTVKQISDVKFYNNVYDWGNKLGDFFFDVSFGG